MNILRKKYIEFKSEKNKLRDSLFGDKNYNKFVIVSDSRTGSTLLMQMLNSHPNILALGEVFKNLGGNSCKQIWEGIFRNRPKQISWVGFKLFYFHPWQNEDREVWSFIEDNKDIIVIHLTRKNILKSYVSKQIGLKTRKWTENVNRPHQISEEEKKLQLDPEECRKNFDCISGYIEQTEQRFKNHKIIPIFYEDLDKDKQGTMDLVFSELGVTNFNISTYMKKQNPEKLEDLISNFNDLKREFADTRWEYLFEE